MEDIGWINLPQDMNYRQAVVDAVINLLILYGTGIFLTSWGTISFSRTLLHGGIQSINSSVTQSVIWIHKFVGQMQN